MRVLIVVVTMAVASAASAAAITLPAKYPATPDEAASLYSSAIHSLHPVPAPTDDASVSPTQYIGKAVAVSGELVGRVVTHADDPEDRLILLRLKLKSGQTVCVTSATEIDGLPDGEAVRAILDVPAEESTEAKFRLRAIVREYDLPQPPAGEKDNPSSEESEPERPGGVIDLVGLPGNAADRPRDSSVPTLRPFSQQSGQLPRPGKQGTWDPADRAVYPEVDAATLNVWKNWILAQNGNLAPWQADWIARWVIYYSRINGVDTRLMFAMIKCESSFNPHAVSSAGAVGLTQLMPGNIRKYHMRNKWNVQEQLRVGIKHFAGLLETWKDRPPFWQFALAAASYNAGVNRVKRCQGVPNITETRNYVNKMGGLFYDLYEQDYPK